MPVAAPPAAVEAAVRALRERLGADKVCTDESARREYFDDITECPGRLPDVVVRAREVGDVQAVLRIANEHRVPVVPVVANYNVGGLAIPDRGGIVLDLKAMNRIVEVNEDDLYLVIEPGVTTGDVRKHLDAHHPGLRIGYSFAPPTTSLMANALMDGLTNLSLREGPTGDWVNGVEVVLPSGELVRTGLGQIGPWCSHSPLPRLENLFINFHGTTGVVTKLALQAFPQRRYRKRMFVLAWDVDHAYSLLRRVTREEICDDIGGLGWPIAKLLFGDPNPVYRDPAEPLLFLFFDVTSNHKKEFALRLEILADLMAAEASTGGKFSEPLDIEDLVGVEPAFAKFADFPTRLDFLLDHPGKGLTWVGTYGPISRWAEGVKATMAVMEKHGYPPILVSRPMRRGHFGVLRMIALFDKRDADSVARVHALNEELSDVCVKLGFWPYKTPDWVVRRHRDRLDPGYVRLVESVRDTLDPNRVMNPGRWPLGERPGP